MTQNKCEHCWTKYEKDESDAGKMQKFCCKSCELLYSIAERINKEIGCHEEKG